MGGCQSTPKLPPDQAPTDRAATAVAATVDRDGDQIEMSVQPLFSDLASSDLASSDPSASPTAGRRREVSRVIAEATQLPDVTMMEVADFDRLAPAESEKLNDLAIRYFADQGEVDSKEASEIRRFLNRRPTRWPLIDASEVRLTQLFVPNAVELRISAKFPAATYPEQLFYRCHLLKLEDDQLIRVLDKGYTEYASRMLDRSVTTVKPGNSPAQMFSSFGYSFALEKIRGFSVGPMLIRIFLADPGLIDPLLISTVLTIFEKESERNRFFLAGTGVQTAVAICLELSDVGDLSLRRRVLKMAEKVSPSVVNKRSDQTAHSVSIAPVRFWNLCRLELNRTPEVATVSMLRHWRWPKFLPPKVGPKTDEVEEKTPTVDETKVDQAEDEVPVDEKGEKILLGDLFDWFDFERLDLTAQTKKELVELLMTFRGSSIGKRLIDRMSEADLLAIFEADLPDLRSYRDYILETRYIPDTAFLLAKSIQRQDLTGRPYQIDRNTFRVLTI